MGDIKIGSAGAVVPHEPVTQKTGPGEPDPDLLHLLEEDSFDTEKNRNKFTLLPQSHSSLTDDEIAELYDEKPEIRRMTPEESGEFEKLLPEENESFGSNSSFIARAKEMASIAQSKTGNLMAAKGGVTAAKQVYDAGGGLVSGTLDASSVVKDAVISAIPSAASVFNALPVVGAVVSAATTGKSIWDARKLGSVMEKTRGLLADSNKQRMDEMVLVEAQKSPQNQSAVEITEQTLLFAVGKWENKASRLKTKSVGGTIATAGAATVAGGILTGPGAIATTIAGTAVAATGAVVSAIPHGIQVKHSFKANKGVARESSSKFLLGLALHKAVQDARLLAVNPEATTAIENSIASSTEAREAYKLANEWAAADPAGIKQAQETVSQFLGHLGVVNLGNPNDTSSYALKPSELSEKGLGVIMERLKSMV